MLSLLQKEGFQPRSFLFFDTSSYKNTDFIGIVERENETISFVKIYKETCIAAENREKARTAHTLFSSSFEVAAVEQGDGRILALTLLSKVRNTSVEEVWPKVLEHSVALLHDATQQREWTELSWYEGNRSSKEVMGHGDLSHWNCFWNQEDQLCLIDYEEIALYPPMYDCFHLLLKPSLLHGTVEIPISRCKEIANACNHSLEEVGTWLYLYLDSENKKDIHRNKKLQNSLVDETIDNRRIMQQKCKEWLQNL